MRKTHVLIALFIVSFGFSAHADKAKRNHKHRQHSHPDFHTPAYNQGVDPKVVEGVCRYETDSGRVKVHHNRNGSWDVGYCQNHRKVSKRQPRIPKDQASVNEAAKELRYWARQHKRFCVDMVRETNKCGKVIHGKWRGIRNCKRPHYWFIHYNHGFRVNKDTYDKKVACFIENGFKKCPKKRWKRMRPKKNNT